MPHTQNLSGNQTAKRFGNVMFRPLAPSAQERTWKPVNKAEKQQTNNWHARQIVLPPKGNSHFQAR